MTYTRKTAPTTRVINLDLAKQQVKMASAWTDEDGKLLLAIDAATDWVEGRTGRSLMTQTWQLSICAFPVRLWLPRAAPLAAVTHVKYYNSSNVLTTLSSSVYTVPAFSEPAYITLVDGQSWPSVYTRDDAVQIEYITGVSDPGSTPASLREAVQMLVGHYYANREEVVTTGAVPKEIPLGAKALCGQYMITDRIPQWEAV